jgi:hypothetical protein
MSQKFKVTMSKILVNDNGDNPGKSELYWSLMVDDQIIDSLDAATPRKVGDGETILLGNSATVTKGDNAALVVLGNVSDSDAFLKGADDTASFKASYTRANDWGVGSHTARLSDGKHLDVQVYYSIARA